MGKAYTNDIRDAEVSIAIEQLLVAEFPTAWTPARIDVAAPPSGFVHLGAVVEDTPSVSVEKNLFQLETGVPMITQYQAVIGLSGTLEATLHSYSWRKVQYALGNYATVVNSYTCITSIDSVISNAILVVSDVESLAAGSLLVTASTTPGLNDADALESKISSLGDVVSINSLTVYLETELPSTPTAGDWVGCYDFVMQYIGTSKLRNMVILGVADFIDGAQVVHHILKAQAGGTWAEEIRPDANARTPLEFTMFGQSVTTSPVYGGSDELIVAQRYFFPPA